MSNTERAILSSDFISIRSYLNLNTLSDFYKFVLYLLHLMDDGMFIDIEPKPIESIAPGPILQQTTYWGHVKSIQGWEAQAFDFELKSDLVKSKKKASKNQNHYDDLLIVTKNIGGGAEIAYVPYGPKILPDEEIRGHFLEELSESLKPYLPKSCILIRYDLPWQSPWMEERDCFNDQGEWLGPPEPRVREFRMNYGTKQWNLRKAPTDILPSSTLFIDLKESHESLLKRMKPKTRYNIHLARRKGVKVLEVGIDFLDIWYDLYCQTAKRNKITLHGIDYFKSLLNAKMKTGAPDTKLRILIAEVLGKPVAGMFLVQSGGRATYLYGASSTDFRDYMGTYALQWEAIVKSKEAGCYQYDMFGISQLPDPAHPMFGLYRFKSGFGGRLHHRQGCWDYPLREKLYPSYTAAELTSAGYHLS